MQRSMSKSDSSTHCVEALLETYLIAHGGGDWLAGMHHSPNQAVAEAFPPRLCEFNDHPESAGEPSNTPLNARSIRRLYQATKGNNEKEFTERP